MERAFDATHKAIAETRAATAGDTETRNEPKEFGSVQSGMWCQSPLSADEDPVPPRQIVGHETSAVVLAVARSPRLRMVSKLLSTQTWLTA